MSYLTVAIFIISALCCIGYLVEYTAGRVKMRTLWKELTVYQWSLAVGWLLTPAWMIFLTIYTLTGGSL